MRYQTFAQFETETKALGFDTVLVRTWEPNQIVAEHSHPFDVHAMVVAGDYQLHFNNEVRHLKIGDLFELPRDQLHSEQYGPDGCSFWVARRA